MNDSSRRARLNSIKLTALVRDHLGGEPEFRHGEFPSGAALRHIDPRRGDTAWVLLADQPERGLGAALPWAVRQGAAALQVVAETGTGLLARRAAGFAFPIAVWHAEGRVLLPAVAEPLPAPPEVPAAHRELVATIVEAGATPGEEFGVLFGEVAGLEVCRVVDDPYLHTVRLEVGVGAHDREAFLAMHGDRPSAPALADVVQAVVRHRVRPGTGHPLSRLGQERLLRAELVAHPEMIGATWVELMAPPVQRKNLKDAVPCVAVAEIAGVHTTVVCSVGVDLDAVPYCIDARLASGIEPCVLVVPRRDVLPVQQLLADTASPPVTIVPVD